MAAGERRSALVWKRRLAHALPLFVRRARYQTGVVLVDASRWGPGLLGLAGSETSAQR